MENKVTDKVRKMLALANNSAASEGERDNAMRMAFKLLAKHNMSMADVSEGSATQEEREQQMCRMSVFPWARSIAYTIADLFFCSYYYQRSGGKLAHHYFVGKQSNATTANEIAQYVVSSVFKELRQRFGSETSPEARSFATGVEVQLRQRVAQLRKEVEQETAQAAPGTSLVLASVYATEQSANKNWLAVNVANLVQGKARTKGTVTGSAYAAGKTFGESISLNKQVK